MLKNGTHSEDKRRQGSSNPSRLLCFVAICLLAGTVCAEVRNDRWRWSNPAPHGNNVLDMKVSTDVAVQVGDAGALHVQHSDGRWTPVATGTDNYLRSTALMGDRIIVTGESGTILWSDDGITFEDASIDTLNWFEGVSASSQRAVAVGDEGAIYTSTDGSNWTETISGTSEWLRGVAAGASGFVAVGENGTILHAPISAATWTTQTSGTGEHLNRVRFLGGGSGQFYAVGNNGTLLHSDTGTSWLPMDSGSTNDLYDIALNTAGLLLVGDQELRMSIDGGSNWVDQINELPTNAPPAWVYLSAYGKGTSWLVAGRTGLLMEGSCTNGIDCTWQPSPSDSSHVWLWDMTVQNGIYIAVGDLAHIKTSLDGILWTQEVVPVSYTNTVLLGVGGTSNLLLAVGNDGNILASQAGAVEVTVTNAVGSTTNLMVGTYGVVWTNLASFTTNALQGVDASDGLFIVSGGAGEVFTSANGTNWTERTTPTDNFLSSVAIGDAACVAVGDNGTVIRSTDHGASWSTATAGITTGDWLYRVRWMEGRFIVVGENGKIYTSLDGLSWTSRTSGTTKWLTDATYADGQWFVSGYQGTLLTSTNLLEWSKLMLPTGKSLFAASEKDGQLVLAGIEGVTLRNQIVSCTTPVALLDYSHSIITASNAVDTVYELFLFGGEPDQFFDFQSTTNLTADTWESLNGTLELYDPSGTLYAILTRDATNAPPAGFYHTQLVP